MFPYVFGVHDGDNSVQHSLRPTYIIHEKGLNHWTRISQPSRLYHQVIELITSIQVLPRSGHLFAHMMAKSTRGARKASRRGNRATTRVQNRQLKPSDAIFRPSCGDSTKKVCTGVGARGGCRTVSPVRGCLQWN